MVGSGGFKKFLREQENTDKQWCLMKQVVNSNLHEWMVDAMPYANGDMQLSVGKYSLQNISTTIFIEPNSATTLETSIDVEGDYEPSSLSRLSLSTLLLIIANLNQKSTLHLYQTCRYLYLLLALRVTGEYARLRAQRHAWWEFQLAFMVIETKTGVTVPYETQLSLKNKCLIPLGIANPLKERWGIPFWQHLYGRYGDKMPGN